MGFASHHIRSTSPSHETTSESTEQVTKQTELAAKDIMQNSQWNGKTVVMIWEHKHIANKKLSRDYSDHFVELRQLLKFDRLPENIKSKIPKTWSGANYNFFWIVDYDDKGNPIGFQEIRQNFTGKFANLPNNNWEKQKNFLQTLIAKNGKASKLLALYLAAFNF